MSCNVTEPDVVVTLGRNREKGAQQIPRSLCEADAARSTQRRERRRQDSDSDEEELEVESPAKSGGKVLVGLTVFLGGLLMVVAISSAAYMAYQRGQAQQRPLTAASPAAEAAAPSQAAAAPSDDPPAAAAEPTFTGGPGGPEAGG
eukprot:symbB.v1.2.027023.t2/scaffold2745.1/size71781/2